MKNNIVVVVILYIVIITHSYGQGYGGRSYLHNSPVPSMLTTAKVTHVAVGAMDGFVMAGGLPTASSTDPDFVIDQTDLDGVLQWSSDYFITFNSLCNGSPQNNHGCSAIDIIETNPGTSSPNEKYALAGVCADGIFFATLDANGLPIRKRMYYFDPSNGIFPSVNNRPTIRESTTNPGWYYICGDVNNSSFVIKVASVPQPTGEWAEIYYGFRNEARSVIESPYNSLDLVVVGKCDPPAPNAALATEATFMTVNANTGAFVSMNCYSDGSNGDDWFTSIEEATSTTGGSNGYIVGGRLYSSTLMNTAYKPWMLKLDPAGNVIWSSLIVHAVASTPVEVYDVLERYNGVTGTYECFGVAHTPITSGSTANKMTVWKMDDAGFPVASPSEFQYPLGSLPSSWSYDPVQIESIGDGTNTGDGIQVFGTDVAASRHRLVSSYFNGVNGTSCYNNTDWTREPGPGSTVQVSLQQFSWPSCSFGLTPSNQIGNMLTTCSWNTSLAAPASNAKGAATGTQSFSEHSNNFSVHPNPTNKAFKLEFKNEVNGPAQITVLNSLGQIEKKIDISNNASDEFELDFEALQLSEGFYFVTVKINTETYTNKVIYKK